MTSRPFATAIVATMIVMAAGSVVPAAAQREARQHQAIVSVVDRNGKPIEGLTAADFVVREDDVASEILKVETASAPMQIVLLADTSGGTQLVIQDVRKGLQAFARAIWARSPDSEIALMEFGERPSQVAEFSRTFAVLDRGIGRLFERSGGGAYLLEAIVDATSQLKKREAKRPVIVAFTTEGAREFSNQTYQQIEAALRGANATLWAIELHSADGSDNSDEAHNRNVVLGDVAPKSGGARDTLLDRMGIERQFTELADRLISQYVLTYGRPDTLIPPSRLEVTVKRAGARVLAPHWTGQ